MDIQHSMIMIELDALPKIPEVSPATPNQSFDCGARRACVSTLMLRCAGLALITHLPCGAACASGWTEFPTQPEARVIHLANSGDDSNPGTPTRPKSSFLAGYQELRDGKADVLLLRRGDVWEVNHFRWEKSGPVANNAGWMRIGAYGDEKLPRPVLEGKSGDALVFTPGYRSNRFLSHIALTDICVLASERLADPARASKSAVAVAYIAAEWQGEGYAFRHMHCENLKIRGFTVGLNIAHDMEDFRLRRSTLADIFSPGNGHGQGVLTAADGVLLEENVFYRIQHPDTPGVKEISYFSHPAYITAEAKNVVCRGNFIFRSTEGFMIRAGGVYERNVSAENGIASMFGQAYGVNPTPGGVIANVRQNLFLNNSGGFSIGNTKSGSMEDNLLLRSGECPVQQNLTLIGQNAQGNGSNIGVHNMKFAENLICGSIVYSSGGKDSPSYSGLVFLRNRTEAPPIDKTVNEFLSSIGCKGATLEDYASILVERDRATFREEVTTRPMINFYRTASGVPLLP